MNSFTRSLVFVLALLVFAVFLWCNGMYCLGLLLHSRTLFCGLLPLLTFYPPASLLVDRWARGEAIPAFTQRTYALFLACGLGSACGFLLLTLRLGSPFILFLISAGSILIFRRWWWEHAGGHVRDVASAYSREGAFIEKGLLFIAFLFAVCAALLPPIGYDAHEYHLACPQEYLEAGAWVAFPYNIYAGFPMNVEMLYLWPLSMQSVAGCTVLNLVFALCTVLALTALARRWGIGKPWLVALLFLGMGFVLKLVVQANIDMALAASAAILLLAYEEYRETKQGLHAWMMALALGYSLGAKYIAILSVFIPFLVMAGLDMVLNRRRDVFWPVFWGLVGGLCLFLPWLVRNMILYRNPMYPLLMPWFGGTPDFYVSLFQAAHAPPRPGWLHLIASFFWLPIQRGVIDVFPAGFSCLWLIALPRLCGTAKTHPAFRALVFGVVTYLGWFFLTQHNDRFLASILPLLALFPAFVFVDTAKDWLHYCVRGIVFVIVVVQLWFAASFLFASDAVDYLTAPTFERDFLAEQLPHFQAIEWLNAQKRDGAEVGTVLFIGEAQTYGAVFDTIAPTVFNYHPLRNGLPSHVTHVLYNRFELARLQKGYGPLGWPLGLFLENWMRQNGDSLLKPVFDAYPQKPGSLVVYRVKKGS